MADFTTFADLESPLYAEPLFYVEPHGKAPDDTRRRPEAFRQESFVAYLRKTSPGITPASFANEGKRSTYAAGKLKKGGLAPGMPDICCIWDGGWAFIEFKGFTASGQPGKLSPAQIDACNKIHRNGHPVACFFTATAALDWLRGLGAPVRGTVAA